MPRPDRSHPARRALTGAAAVVVAGGCLVGGFVAGTTTAAAAVIGDRLTAGATLRVGDSLVSTNGVYSLVLQGDGNLVEYAGGRALWSTSTAGRGANRLVLQGDGNLVLYTASGAAVWASGGFTAGPSALVVRGDGGLSAVRTDGSQYWGVATRADLLASGAVLTPGRTLWSPSAQYRMSLQGDGNLVLYAVTGVPVWWTSTTGSMSGLTMQTDGDLVLRRVDGSVAWRSGTSGNAGAGLTVTDVASALVGQGGVVAWRSPAPAATVWRNQVLASNTMIAAGTSKLVMQSDGNLVRYANGAATWASGTRSPGARAVMQSDGNLVVYATNGTALWWSATTRTTATFLRLSPAGLAYLGNTTRVPNWVEGPPNWAGLAQCESGGNPRAVNPAGYYGLYQFDLGTWASNGGTGNPVDATPAVQTAVASTLYLARGRQPWPVCGTYL